jgi:prolyl-tRNA editing enzyme YbaK/EbsC (Cys-tRNA(Pro) deacylase)
MALVRPHGRDVNLSHAKTSRRAVSQISWKELAKTVVLWTWQRMILAVLRAPNRVRLDKLAAELGRSVRLATAQEFSSLSSTANYPITPHE